MLPFLSLLSPLSQAKRTLPELRKLYFELKDEIFATASHSGYNCDTGKLEQLLKKYLGDTMKLSDVDHPKYVDRWLAGSTVSIAAEEVRHGDVTTLNM